MNNWLQAANRLQATGYRLQIQADAASAATVFSPSSHQPLGTSHSSSGPWPLTPNPCLRRGISLLEVLFAMGILLIGLLGVGAMIPAGRFEVLQGAKIDHASAVGRQAFRDLKVRGYLNPLSWSTFNGSFSPACKQIPPATGPWQFTLSTNSNPTVSVFPAYVIDPLGAVAAAATPDIKFPYQAAGPYLQRVVPFSSIAPFQISPANGAAISSVAEPIFRSVDDLVIAPSAQGKDFPPSQSFFWVDSSGNVTSHSLPATGSEQAARRLSAGDYSWLATIVCDPLSPAIVNVPVGTVGYAARPVGKVTVSVAVFHKRNLADLSVAETATTRVIAFPASPAGGQRQPALSGGEVVLYFDPLYPNNLKPVKPGQWIMLAGQQSQQSASPPPITLSYFRWYRVVAASDVLDVNQSSSNPKDILAGVQFPADLVNSTIKVQTATLQGADWSAFPAAGSNLSTALPNTPWPYVWIIDNVIAVFEKNLKLEIQ